MDKHIIEVGENIVTIVKRFIRNLKEYDLIPSLQRRDGVTIGISAGSINMSDNVVLLRYDKETLFYKGIGLIDINVDPHFSFEDEKYIQNSLLPSSYGKNDLFNR